MVVYFLVYVDDIVLTGSSASVLAHLISILSTDFPLKDMEDLHYVDLIILDS